MEPDPNKKKDTNPKKPSIKIKQINIPENLRNILNPAQGQGQGAGVRGAPGSAPAIGVAGASGLSTLDPFIKVMADSNRGII